MLSSNEAIDRNMFMYTMVYAFVWFYLREDHGCLFFAFSNQFFPRATSWVERKDINIFIHLKYCKWMRDLRSFMFVRNKYTLWWRGMSFCQNNFVATLIFRNVCRTHKQPKHLSKKTVFRSGKYTMYSKQNNNNTFPVRISLEILMRPELIAF